MSNEKNPHIGSSFDDFLREDGIYEEVTAKSIKNVVAWHLQQAIEQGTFTKTALAKRLKTSRSQLDRFLDPENESATLATIMRAADVLGKNIRVEIR